MKGGTLRGLGLFGFVLVFLSIFIHQENFWEDFFLLFCFIFPFSLYTSRELCSKGSTYLLRKSTPSWWLGHHCLLEKRSPFPQSPFYHTEMHKQLLSESVTTDLSSSTDCCSWEVPHSLLWRNAIFLPTEQYRQLFLTALLKAFLNHVDKNNL